MSTETNEVAEKMNKGVTHGTLAQLDKYSDEHVLQRISEPVTEACIAVDKAIRTDIPELRRPWFADNHNKVISPMFLAVSKYGVVFYTDESKNTMSFIVKHRYLVRSTLCLVWKVKAMMTMFHSPHIT